MHKTTVGPIQGRVEISNYDGAITADLDVPSSAVGIVIFAHGSGSGRLSASNWQVASVLRRAGLATLLVDLLTEDETLEDELTGALRFDIGLLTTRLTRAIAWVRQSDELRDLPIGLFGVSTGGAAALAAAAADPEDVAAVVSRGGHPDLAGARLEQVRAPTLLMAGGYDPVVIALTRDAFARLRSEKRLTIVPCATHLFEEPGTLDQMARLAEEWFTAHLAVQPAGATITR